MKKELVNIFKASFCIDSKLEDGIAYICCGDCFYCHIDVFRNKIIELYNKNHVSKLKKNKEKTFYFLYSSSVDMEKVAKEIGIINSGPSTSSSSNSTKNSD